jgi:radical SAM superfamily enzyme YgiQ (UPF0313 family)
LIINTHPVFLIAFGEEENLGVGYLRSVLNTAGIESRMVDLRYDNEEILACIRRHDPVTVGFSVIFEVYIEEFAQLARYLRKGGINCHFTAGGYYASLHPDELFRLIPELDSIVRFEGEYTFLELIKCLITEKEWKSIRNIAFRENGHIITTPLRNLEKDLDRFPFPVRKTPGEYAPGRMFTTIISGRGCIYDCTFCNTREFYRQAGGPVKRIRSPEMVVREMHQLYAEKRCTVFLFQDDDFPVKCADGNSWIKSFCSELEQGGLLNRVMWKINCRPDEVDPDTFLLMKKHGLFLVFLGLEDGTDEGLKRLNKRMRATTGTTAVETLRRLDIGYDYGMMMFQPETSFGSLRENLKFLEKVCSDGTAPITFLKLMPYFSTELVRELSEQGRLNGRPGYLDYRLRSEPLDACWSAVTECLAEWLWGSQGVVNLAKWVRNWLAVSDYFGNSNSPVEECRTRYRDTVAQSNLFLAETMTRFFDYYESGDYITDGQRLENNIKTDIEEKHQLFCRSFAETLKSLRAEALF